MSRFGAALACCLIAATASARVLYVDNRATAPGAGTAERPFATISAAEAASGFGDILYVMETSRPYVENVALKRGQMLLGSAAGVEDPPIPKMAGQGPQIRGTITAAADSVIAGCSIVAEGNAGIVAYGGSGTLTIRDVWFWTSLRAFAIYVTDAHGDISISGGGLVAADGSGIGIAGGYGEVAIDNFPMEGDFATAVQIARRQGGTIRFRRGSRLRVRDAIDDAVAITNVDRPAAVVFEDAMSIRGHRRGLVVQNVNKLTIGGASSIATTNGAALDVRDSNVELSFESLSAAGVAPGKLDEGVVVDRVHGSIAVTGVEGKPGSGGTISNARLNGVRIVQSDNVRLKAMAIRGSGGEPATKGARCAGEFDANTTAPCSAALYLRHVAHGRFDDVVIDGGGAIGINANNIRDVIFSAVEVRGTGNETFESGVLLQDLGGDVTFARGTFADNAGSEMLVEQRFGSGRLVLDRCSFSGGVAQLLAIHAARSGRLRVEIDGARFTGPAAIGIDASATDTASICSVLTGNSFDRTTQETRVRVDPTASISSCP